MQFPNMDEEDGDFNLGSAGRSRLSSLFQGDNATGDVNQALTYTAPKQPRKNGGNQSASPSALKLLHAVVVHAHKLENEQYANQGKLGCAVLGCHETSNYKFLLYKGKQIQVTYCNITANFVLHVQPNNYANFYDEKKENWSLMFTSEDALIALAKQVGLAKANSYGKNLSSVIIQDLVPGDGPSLEDGCVVEVKYTGWLWTNFGFGQEFDSNMKSDSYFKLKLGKGKVIKGWNEGLRGAKLNSQRLLIVPSALAYGSQGMGNSVPPNSTLIFEIHVKKTKFPRESSHSPTPYKIVADVITTEKKPEVPPRTHSVSNEDSVRMRGASISEQLSQSPKKDKAQLISRMAKMGTATLPFQGAVPAQTNSGSDDEDEARLEAREPSPVVPFEAVRSREASPKPSVKSRTSSFAAPTSHAVHPQPAHRLSEASPVHLNQLTSQPLSLYAQAPLSSHQAYMQSPMAFPSFPPTMGSQFTVPQQQYPVHAMPSPVVNSMADTHLPLLITEARNQNTEVRLSLGKITDKVDTVIQKVDGLRSQQPNISGPGQASYMEGLILAQNIERIVQENCRLKEEVDVKNAKLQSLNEKICDLLQRNQGFFEESNCVMEQRSDSLHATALQTQTKLLKLEQEKIMLTADLSASTSKASDLEAELAQQKRVTSELQQRITKYEKYSKKQEELLSKTSDQSGEDQMLVKSLKEELESLVQERKLLQTKLQDVDEKCRMLEKLNQTLEEKLLESKKEMEDVKSQVEFKMAQMKQESDADTNKATAEIAAIISTYKDQIEVLKKKGEDSDESLVESGKLKQEIEKLRGEKVVMGVTMEGLKEKLSSLEKSEAYYKEQLSGIQSQVDNAMLWKKKYEIFHDKTRAMKEGYEQQISELVNTVMTLQSTKQQPPEFASEVKKVMNALYKTLQTKIDASATYSGEKVLEISLQIIRALIFQILQQKREVPGDATKGNSAFECSGGSMDQALPESKSEVQTGGVIHEKEDIAHKDTVTLNGPEKSTTSEEDQQNTTIQSRESPDNNDASLFGDGSNQDQVSDAQNKVL